MINPSTLTSFLCTPENPRNFKYATRQFSDDDALVLVEQLLDKAAALREMGDRSEDWSIRLDWLQSLVSELWRSRGLHPGMTKVLKLLDLARAILPYKKQAEMGKEREAYEAIVGLLEGRSTNLPWLNLMAEESKRLGRQWRLRSSEERRLLRDLLPCSTSRSTRSSGSSRMGEPGTASRPA